MPPQLTHLHQEKHSMSDDSSGGDGRAAEPAPASAPAPALAGPDAPHRSVSIQSCEREPIHIINRIQPCGYLIVVDADLNIVQCSTNVPELLPAEERERLLAAAAGGSGGGAAAPNETAAARYDDDEEARNNIRLLNGIVSRPLSLLLSADAVERVRGVVRSAGAKTPTARAGGGGRRSSLLEGLSGGGGGRSGGAGESEATRNFLIRSGGTSFAKGCADRSCTVIPSGENFLLELEHIERETCPCCASVVADGGGVARGGCTCPAAASAASSGGSGSGAGVFEDWDAMTFMECIARELRKCWSIEEMASLVCARIMEETPYDRGMVYRFDHDDSGEIIYESFRQDARMECKKDSFLGLRFPATDIPRQARELFMRNTLRFVYDVNGKDHELFPAKVRNAAGDAKYTDLSMCRLRGSSYMHLKYLKNMQVTSTMVIAIIVNKRLWGLYSFHGYREPLVPTSRTRFLCEMASIMTSMIMESSTRMADQTRLMDIDKVMCNLQQSSLPAFLEHCHDRLKELLDVNLIACRTDEPALCKTFGPNGTEIAPEVFDCLHDAYGDVCKGYGVVFIDEQKSHPILNKNELHTLAYYRFPGNTGGGETTQTIDILLSRQSTVERVQWGGDPDKTLEPDGTLSPRNSFAAYVKNHLKTGRPWSDVDRRAVNRLVDEIGRYRSAEMFREHAETIQTLRVEKEKAIDDARVNFDFFAHLAHELRTPFHGILGSLEAMREDPALANNELLRTAEMCGTNMIKILDDILLVAKGSYSLVLEEQSVEVSDFMKQSLGDMHAYAHMEGVSIRLKKEDVIHRHLLGDFNRVRQVINNLISNAIKFSDEDIAVEMLQRKTFLDVLSVWKTYKNMYPNCEPPLKDIEAHFQPDEADNDDDVLWMIVAVIDKGIGISGPDLKRLGTAFTQLSSGRQKKYQGTGLGVNICKMLVTTLMGKLVMFSVPDFGSCFTFAIPVRKGNDKDESVVVDGSGRAKTADELKKEKMERLRLEFEGLGLAEDRFLKVLVVDDSAINRKLCSRKIKRWLPSITITECPSGKSALEEFEYDHRSIMGIFLDYHMHGMDGAECTRLIREYEGMHEGVGHVYIAGYTADLLDECTEKLLQAGMDSVIPKPEPVQAFETALRSMMECYQKKNNKRGKVGG